MVSNAPRMISVETGSAVLGRRTRRERGRDETRRAGAAIVPRYTGRSPGHKDLKRARRLASWSPPMGRGERVWVAGAVVVLTALAGLATAVALTPPVRGRVEL